MRPTSASEQRPEERLIVLMREQLGPVPLLIERLPMRQPEHHRGLHVHDFIQLVYVESGSGAIHMGAGTTGVEQGQITVVAPGQVHDLGDVDPGTDAWVLSLPEELARPSLHALAHAPRASTAPGYSGLIIPADTRDRWSRRIGTIECELREQRLGYEDLVRHELGALMIELVRLMPASAAPGPRISPLARRVLDLIEREHTRPLTLGDIAHRVRRSPAHLTTLVRKELGKPILQLIIEQRLQTACRWLAETDELIDVIAERSGFHDPAYFTRLFRRHHGMSPRAWRQAHARPAPYHASASPVAG